MRSLIKPPLMALFLLANTFAHVAFTTCSGNAPCTCSVSATAMSFGNYVFTTSSSTNTTNTITVTCTSGALAALNASYVISSSLSVAGNPQRWMIGPSSEELLYNLYTTNARTTIWADASAGTATLSGSCSQGCLLLCGARSCNQNFTIYGGIAPNQPVQAGSYAETVTITVTF